MIAPLRPGDQIAITATARKISHEEIELAIKTFESWGLQVAVGQTIGASYGYFAGDDALRLQELQQLLDDAAIKAIVCARGGYGTTRIIDQLDFSTFQQQPKWLVGFSDVTALHSHIHNLGQESIHGIMPLLFAQAGTQAAIDTLRRALFGKELTYEVAPHALNRNGTATGRLVGGNLSMLHNLTGTRSDTSTEGKLLFLEDLDEYLYHLDRMLVHLDRCGKLARLAGLVVGHMSDMKDTLVPFGKNAYEIILEHAGKYNYPIAFGFPVGHQAQNLALICGRQARLEVNGEEVRLAYCS